MSDSDTGSPDTTTGYDVEKAADQFEKGQKLPDGIVRELGRVSVAFSRMELAAELLFASLIDQNQHVGRALLSMFGGLELKLKAIETVYIARHGVEDPFYGDDDAIETSRVRNLFPNVSVLPVTLCASAKHIGGPSPEDSE